MCGIFGVILTKKHQAAAIVLKGLKLLEYRGYDSWGIALKSETHNSILVDKHIGKIGEAVSSLPSGTIAIGHTRWATHGGVTDANAHPHLDCLKQIAVIHNGIVENYHEIKSQLVQNGHIFESETDTEIIAHLIEEKSKKINLISAVFQTFKELQGSNAITVLDSKNNQIIACRNGSPLVIGMNKNHYFIASDVPAFLEYANTVHFMQDGEAAVLKSESLTLYNYSTEKKLELSTQKLDWKLEDAQKDGYAHFMLKEIMEQKKIIIPSLNINNIQIQSIAQKIKDGYKIVIIGCGTAAYCGIAAKYFFALNGIESQVYGAYEFLPFSQFTNSKTLCIAISQSGETADTLIAVKKMKKNGAYIVGVINAKGSTLERLSDSVLSVGAGPEIAVVSTKAFTAQLITLYCLAYATQNNLDKVHLHLSNLSKKLNIWLQSSLHKKIIKIAKTLIDHEDIYVIGKHLQYVSALECALKIKESSYVHAEAFASGELKHGVITLIQKNTPCLVFAQNNETFQEVCSSAAELKARGGNIIGISPKISKEFNIHIQTPDVGDLTIVPNIIVGQLLGYYLGIGRGTDPDKPRNLAKSVTVK